MKKHGIFENPPIGFRLYVTDWDGGVWLLLPIYWIAARWRDVRIAYTKWSVMRRRRRAQ